MDELDRLKEMAGILQDGVFADYDTPIDDGETDPAGYYLKKYQNDNVDMIISLIQLENELIKRGHRASAESVSNIIGSMQENKAMFDAAVSDIGKE